MLSLDIFQSWWAMEFRRPDGFEWSIEERFEKITNADYQGVCFEAGLAHIPYDSLSQYDLDIVINAFPRNAEDVAKVTQQWLKQGKEAQIPIYVEGHRNCMTNDLLFTLQLMDAVPELKMTADLSHFMVNQEWVTLPLEDHEQALISRFLDRSESFQGRIASPEQVQIQLGFPQHEKWVNLFLNWWVEGLANWRRRHVGTNDRCVFLCELSPSPYVIKGADGYELTSP
jgi:hypothetical protein